MYELIILGRLMRAQMHGYIMTKIINGIIGPFAKMSNGRFYPLLAKLEADGFVTPVVAGDQMVVHNRHQHPYQITEAGRARFHEIMLDVSSNPGDYRTIFWIKVQFFYELRSDERLYLIDHYQTYCQSHLFHLRHESQDLHTQNQREHWLSDLQMEHTDAVFRDFLAHWELELAQARELRTLESGRITQLAEEGQPSQVAFPTTEHKEHI